MGMKWKITAVAVLFGAGWLHADVESGPKAGGRISPCKAVVAVGDDEGKELDFSQIRKDQKTIFVFINAERFDRPTARFLKTINDGLEDGGEKKVIVAVWLLGDVEKSKEYIPRMHQSLELDRTVLAVYGESASTPEGWEIASNAKATVVVVDRGEIKASFGYDSVNARDSAKVLAAFKKLSDKAKPPKKPKSEAVKPEPPKSPMPRIEIK